MIDAEIQLDLKFFWEAGNSSLGLKSLTSNAIQTVVNFSRIVDNVMNSLISVVMPFYKMAPYLPRALNSIKTRKTHIQLILVNDGDNTDLHTMIKPWRNSFYDLQIINHDKNYGALQARITGCECAQGDYIHFFDPDDCAVPYAYDSWLDFAMEKKAEIIQFPSRKVEHNGTITEWLFASGWPCELYGGELLSTLFKMMNNWNLWNKLFSRRVVQTSLEILKKIEIGNLLSGNDIPHFFALFSVANSFKICNVPGFYYSPNQAFWTKEGFLKNWDKIVKSNIDCARMLREICDILNTDESVRIGVENWIAKITTDFSNGIIYLYDHNKEEAFCALTSSTKYEYMYNRSALDNIELFRLMCRGIAYGFG